MQRKFATAALVCFLGFGLPLAAHMGDSQQQAVARYGQPVSTQAVTGALTSTQTFAKDGMQIVCGYVDNKVEAISFTRSDRPFVPAEVEALLRTNSQHKNWAPDASGTVYTRADGAKAVLKDTMLGIVSPKWQDALAKDDKAAQEKAAAAATTNTAPSNP